MEKHDIRHLSNKQLKAALVELKEKAFRAKQINEWLWQKGVTSFEEMTNLSKDLRNKLEENFFIKSADVIEKQISSDKTVKFIFELYDGNVVEGVLIPTKNRVTACISSQIGCALKCKFCATGTMQYKRNLDDTEIFDQLVAIKNFAEKEYEQNLTNIVYMGMGEPFNNYDNVISSVKMLTSEEGLAISPYRITISTSGVVEGINRLAEDKLRVNLALSLHSANDITRSEIMPINKKHDLQELTDAIKHYYKETNDRVTLEYLLLKGVNDTTNHARELAEFCKSFPVKINIIEYNPVESLPYEKSDDQSLERFVEFLERCNLVINVRKSRGKDIDAACGQLANKKQK